MTITEQNKTAGSINQMVMMVLAMAIIAGMVGGGGLGYRSIEALTKPDAGLGAELVTLADNNKYRLTKTGYYIATDNLTNVNMNFVADVCYKAMYHLKDSVTEGKPSVC